MSLELKLKNSNLKSSKPVSQHKLSYSHIFSQKTSITSNISSHEANPNMYSLQNYRDGIHKAEVKKINKNLKIYLKKEKEKRIDSVNNLHRETMRESFQNNFYLTEGNSIHQVKITNEKVSFNYNLSPLDKNSLDKEKILSRNFPNNFPQINSLLQSQTDTPKDFIKHVKNIRLSKYFIATKHESIQRLKENRENEVEKFNESIAANKNKRKLFYETIEKLNKFNAYVQSLKEKEKDRLDNFHSKKINLTSEIKKIDLKKTKLKLYL